MSSLVDQERYAAIQTRLRGEAPDVVDPLATLSPADLRRLRSEIDRRLPQGGMNGMDLERELVDQYNLVKDLQATAINDDDIPLNQRSQLAGQVASTLAQLVKMQEDLRREETFKLMESCLVEALKELPDDTREAFYVEYDRLAKKAGLIE